MCKIKFTNPILDSFAKTLDPNGLIDNVQDFIETFNTSDLVYKLDNLEVSLNLGLKDVDGQSQLMSLVLSQEDTGTELTEFDGIWTLPTQIDPIKPEDIQPIKEDGNEIIAYKSGRKTSTRSTDGNDIIKNDLKTKTREEVLKNLDASYVLVNIPDSPDFYPEGYKPKEYHTILVAIPASEVKDGMTLEDILSHVPDFAKWDNRPFPISLEYSHDAVKHSNTAHGKRAHEKRITIRAEESGKEEAVVKELFIQEFNEVQSTKKLVKESNKYAVYQIEEISKGVGGKYNADQKPIPSEHFSHAKFLPGVEVLPTGETMVQMEEKIDGKFVTVDVQMIPKKFTNTQLDFIFDNFTLEDGTFNPEILPVLQFVLGNKPSRDEFGIRYKDGKFALRFTLEKTKFYIAEGSKVSPETLSRLRDRFNTVIFKNYSITLSNRFAGEGTVTIREASDYLLRESGIPKTLLNTYLLETVGVGLDNPLIDYVGLDFYPRYLPTQMQTQEGVQSTYKAVNKYAYLSTPQIFDIKTVALNNFETTVNTAFESLGVEVRYYTSIEELNKAHLNDFGEIAPTTASGYGVNWYRDNVIHMDAREGRPYVLLEEKIHALVSHKINEELKEDGPEIQHLRAIAKTIKEKTKNSKNKAIWDDIFNQPTEGQMLNELIARGTTYPELIAELKSTNFKVDQNLFNIFVDAILDVVNKILGIDSDYYSLLVAHNVRLIEKKDFDLDSDDDLGGLYSYTKLPEDLTKADVRDSLDYLFTLFIAHKDSGVSFTELGKVYDINTKVRFKNWLDKTKKFKFDINIEEWFNDSDSQFRFTEEDSTELDLEDIEKKEEGTAYEKERGTATRIQELLSSRLRQVFRLLPKIDYSKNIVRNTKTGLPQLMPLNEVIQEIYGEISGVASVEEIQRKLQFLARKIRGKDGRSRYANPMFGAFYKFMDFKNNPYSDLAMSFYSMMQNTELKVLKAVSQDGNENVYTESGENKPKILAKWNSNFKENYDDNFVGEQLNDARKKQVIALYTPVGKGREKAPTLQEAYTVAKAFGIVLSPTTLKAINGDPVLKAQIQKAIERLPNTSGILNRFKDFGGTDSIDSATALFKGTGYYALLETLEAEYSPYRRSIMTRNAKGDLINVYSLPNTALLQRNLLNEFREKLGAEEFLDSALGQIVERLLGNITDVKFPASLREKLLSGEIQIEIFNLEGYKKDENESTSDITNYKYINQQAIFWKRMQTFEFQRTETGSSAWGFRFVSNNKPNKTPYIYNLLQEQSAIDQIMPRYKELFEGEILKLRSIMALPNKPFGAIGNMKTKKYNNLIRTLNSLEKQQALGVPNLEGRIEIVKQQLSNDPIPGDYLPFQIFGFLPLETQAKLIKNADADLQVLWQGVEKLVATELRKSIESGKSAIKGYEGDIGKGISMNSLLLNYKLHQTYSNLMFYGDGNWFGKFFKRAKGAVSTGTGNPTSIDMYETLTPDMANVFGDHKGSMEVSVTTMADRNDKYNDETFEAFKQDIDTSIDLFLKEQGLSEEAYTIVKDNLLAGIEAYRQKINTTDGQSWITLDLVKTMLRSKDLWKTQGLDALYSYETTYLQALANNRIDELSRLDGAVLSEEDEAEFGDIGRTRDLFLEHRWDTLLQENKITQEEHVILSNKPQANWQLEKWQYFGNVKEYKEYNPIVFLKSSFAPLAPSEVLGTPMEKVMFEMYRNNTQILTTESAMKGAIAKEGAMSMGEDFNDLQGREFNIFLPYLKEQLKSNHKVKKENLLATQFVKLLFSDTQDSEKRWHSPRTKRLFEEYLKVLNDIRQVEEERLLQQLNVTKSGDKYIVNDKESIKGVLIEELKRRSKNEEITDAQVEFLLGLKGDVNFDYTGMSQTLSEILAGYIKKRLIRIKLPGNALILKTSYGSADLKFYEYQDGKVTYAETKIGMQGTFKTLLKRKDVKKRAKDLYGKPTQEQLRLALNQLIKEGSIDKRALTIFGYRIPTSGINLMDAYVIKEFLPVSAGNTIIVPTESVVKAGEDFDIDKKNFYFPSFGEDGELIQKPAVITNPDALLINVDEQLDAVSNKLDFSKEKLNTIQEAFENTQSYYDQYGTLIEEANTTRDILQSRFKELFERLLDLESQVSKASTKKDKMRLISEVKALKASDLSFNETLSYWRNKKAEIHEYKEEVMNFFQAQAADNKKLQTILNRSFKYDKNQFSKLLKERKRIKNYHKDTIKFHTNRLIDVASQAITQPERFFSLVTPVTTDFLANTLKRTGRPDSPPAHRNTNFETILKKRMEMVLAGQKLTGFSATDSVAIQLFLKQDLKLKDHYIIERTVKKKIVREKIDVVFPTNIFRSAPRRAKDSYDLNSLYTQDGILKSELFNQLVQATIDAATASILAPVNITKDTLSIYQYLAVVVGLPLHEVTRFLNHPSIQRKQSYLDKGQSNNDALVNTLLSYNSDYVSVGPNGMYPNWTYIRTQRPEQISDIYHLYLFEEYKKQANEYLSIKQAINFDTTPDRTAIDAQARDNLIETLQTPTYFPKEVVNGVIADSAVSSKFITGLTKDIYEAFTPIRSNKAFIEKVLLYESFRRTWNKQKRERYRRLVQNDFQEWLVKRHVKIEGKDFNTYFKSIAGSIWGRMKQYPALNENFNLNKTEDGIQHIHIFPSSRDDGSIEGIHKDFRDMEEKDPKLLQDIIVYAIGVHGFNVAPYTWGNMLPHKQTFELINKGIREAEMDLEINSVDIAALFLKRFLQQDDNLAFLTDGSTKYKNVPKYLTEEDFLMDKKGSNFPTVQDDVGFRLSIDKSGKDTFKAEQATSYIFGNLGSKEKNEQGYGLPYQKTKTKKGTSSTYTYAFDAKKADIPVNSGVYTISDKVWVSISGGKHKLGQSKAKFEATTKELDKAIAAGATILADSSKRAKGNSYVQGAYSEQAIIDYLISKGYKEYPYANGDVSEYRKDISIPKGGYNFNSSKVSEDTRDEYKRFVLNKLGIPTTIEPESRNGDLLFKFTFEGGVYIETPAKGSMLSYPKGISESITNLSREDSSYDIKLLIGLNKLAEESVGRQPSSAQELALSQMQKLYPEIKIGFTQDGKSFEVGDGKVVMNQEVIIDNIVRYRLKSIEVLSSNKAEQVFAKGKKNNWNLNKILTELQIPKDQKQLILEKDFPTYINELSLRENIIVSLLADNSFTIEINTAVKSGDNKGKYAQPNFTLPNGDEYAKYGENDYEFYPNGSRKDSKQITKEEYENARPTQFIPNQYYSQLTVPGGTNYRENEISTPGITPNIKGHAQFSTDNGIGWFRSDEQELGYKPLITRSFDIVEDNFAVGDTIYFRFNKKDNKWMSEKESGTPATITEKEIITAYNNLHNGTKITDHKTRRILEVQSDLFQKGRNKSDLINKKTTNYIPYKGEKVVIYTNKGETLTGIVEKYEAFREVYFSQGENQYEPEYPGSIKLVGKDKMYLSEGTVLPIDKKNEISSKNKFLQLLNKKNNWVTFFVKSIIQDSVKKGYEKVLFPKGNTAAKIEGHGTLEEFKKQKEARIEELEKNLGLLESDIQLDEQGREIGDFSDLERESIELEIKQLKEEIADVESGKTQLSSIANFYETTVTNVLKKNGYKLVEITDEYGNKWNEIDVTKDSAKQDILLQKDKSGNIVGQANIKAMTVLFDKNRMSDDTIYHEYAHHYIAWNRDTPIVQEAIKKWGSEEALVQAIGEQSLKQKGQAWEWFKKFMAWLKGDINKLSKLDAEKLKNVLTDAFLTRQDLSQSKPSKKGVQEVFESNSELAKIGTQEEYSQYLDTIFPDSKVKDIVYHGSHSKFDSFDKSLVGSKTRADIKGKGFFFSNSPAIAAGYKQSLDSSNIVNDINFYYYFKKDLGNRDINKITEEEWQDIVLNYYDGETVDLPYIEEQSLEKTKLLFDKFKNDKQFDTVQSAYELDTSQYLVDNSTVYSTLISTKNPLVIEGNNRQMLSIVKKETEALKDNNDGIIFNNVEDGLSGGARFVANTYAVFEPSQIHILGSKADIKGFKDFKKNTTGTNYEATADEIFGEVVSTPTQITREKSSQPSATELANIINDLNKKPYQERIPELIKKGIVTDVYKYGQRPIIVFNINGIAQPFYRSSQGTGGKSAGKWFPMFGFGKRNKDSTELGWLIKPSIEDLNNNLNSKEIKEYSNLANTLFSWVHSLDLGLQNPFINPFITLQGTEADFNNKIYGREDLEVFNDGKTSYNHIDNQILKINNEAVPTATEIFGEDKPSPITKLKTPKQEAFEQIQDRQSNPGTNLDKIANALQFNKITPESFDRWVDKNLKKEKLNFIKTKAKGGSELDVIAQEIEVTEQEIADFILTYKSSTDYWNQQLEAYIKRPSIDEELKGYKSYTELPKENTSSPLFQYAQEKLGSTLAAFVLNRGITTRQEIDDLETLINKESEYTVFRFQDGTSYPLFGSSITKIVAGEKTMSIRKNGTFDGGIFEIQGVKIEVTRESTITNIEELGMTQEEILSQSGITEDIRDANFKKFLEGEDQVRVVYKYKLLNKVPNTNTNTKPSSGSPLNDFRDSFDKDIC